MSPQKFGGGGPVGSGGGGCSVAMIGGWVSGVWFSRGGEMACYRCYIRPKAFNTCSSLHSIIFYFNYLL